MLAMASNPFSILLPYQRRIFNSTARKIICCCSRQIGKSFLAAAKAVRFAITNPKTLTACISTGERASREFLLKCSQWAEACRTCASKDTRDYLAYSASATEIKFANGSRIIVLPSGNPRALRGFTGSVLVDECALIENDREVWAAIVPLLTNKIANKNKWIMVLSTPTGLNTIFAKIWQSPPEFGWEKYRLTIYDAVAQGLPADPAELQKLVNDDFIWRTEYLCEFASTADTAFPAEWLANIGENREYDPRLPCSIGVDVARTSDLTVFVVLQKTADDVYHVVDLVQLHNVPFADQLARLKDVCKKYRISQGFVDATGIGCMFQEECARQISARLKPFVFSANRKTEIFERLRKVLAGDGMRVPAEYAGTIRDDLSQMRRMIDQSIHYTAPHTKSGHADIACALALAVAAEHDVPTSTALPIPGTGGGSQWGEIGSRLR